MYRKFYTKCKYYLHLYLRDPINNWKIVTRASKRKQFSFFKRYWIKIRPNSIFYKCHYLIQRGLFYTESSCAGRGYTINKRKCPFGLILSIKVLDYSDLWLTYHLVRLLLRRIFWLDRPSYMYHSSGCKTIRSHFKMQSRFYNNDYKYILFCIN